MFLLLIYICRISNGKIRKFFWSLRARVTVFLKRNYENMADNCSASNLNESIMTSENVCADLDELLENGKENIWHRFADWVHCICVVTFDLELGQAMEAVYPLHIRLSEQEKLNICYLAFPDSNSGCMGDTKFHIRLRVAPATNDTVLHEQHIKFNTQCLPVQRADPGHYWGFVYFRQTKDSSLPRGYFQKSLVLLTRLPFINLFYEICSLIAPAYFERGEKVLNTVCENICNWPPLAAGETVALRLLDIVYQTVIPRVNIGPYVHTNSVHSRGGASPTSNREIPLVLPTVHEIDIYRPLNCVLPYIHMLWELVLTAEPIVVMAASPTDCSLMVQSLTSLIAPLSYCAESRPYFTIHDSEFKEFTQRPQGPPPIILGVTNPFFGKTLQHWPHTIRVGETINNVSTSAHHSKMKKSKPPSKLFDLNPGVHTKYKPFLQKDKTVIKKIMTGTKTKRPMAAQSALLRRHLLELTQSFIIPLERYMASLMPLQKDISPFKAPPNPNQFKQDDFLATLGQSGPQLTSTLKGDWEGLYKKFFRSPNFKGWFENRHFELTQKLQVLQLKALSEADLKQWVQGKHEVEIVDMILKLKQRLEICEGSSSTEKSASEQSTTEIKNQLTKHLEDMKGSLPDDLKTILKNNP